MSVTDAIMWPPTKESLETPQKNKFQRLIFQYCKLVLRFPSLPILFSVVIIFSLTTWLLLAFGLNPTCNINYHRWTGSEVTNRWDAYLGAGKENYGSLFGFFGSVIGIFRQFQLTQMSAIVYEMADPMENVVTAEHIREIWEFEDELRAIPGYEHYCLKIPFDSLPEIGQKIVRSVMESMKDLLSGVDNKTNCLEFKSITTELRAHMESLPEFVGREIHPQDLTQEILEDFCLNETRNKRIAASYFGTDWNESRFFSTRMRSMFIFGLPLKGYRNKHDRMDEQTAKLGKWQLKFLQPLQRRNRDRRQGHVVPYQAFPFAMEYYIFDMVMKQAGLLCVSFVVMFVILTGFTRSFFVGLLGPIGCIGAIPCAGACLNGVMGVRHIDILDTVGVFFVFTYGTHCMYMLFTMYWREGVKGGSDLKERFSSATERCFISLGYSYVITLSCLVILAFSRVKLISFYAIFSAFLVSFMFLFSFTFYLPIVGIWAKRERRKHNTRLVIPVSESMTELDTTTGMGLQPNSLLLRPEIESSSGGNDNTNSMDYPHTSVLAFLRHKPRFKVDAACLPMQRMTYFQRFFYQYICSIAYFYRLPLVLFTLAFAGVFGYFATQMDKKIGVLFLDEYHELQHALNHLLYGFRTSLSDFSFVYVWGLDPKPKTGFAQRMSVTDYGSPVYRPFDITNPKIQAHINWTDELVKSQDFIDTSVSKDMGVNAWGFWDLVLNFDKRWAVNPLIGPIVELFFKLGLNVTTPPRRMPISSDEYAAYGWLWQTLLSNSELGEPDPYFPGTVKADTTGFSPENYSLQYIGLKKNIRIPEKVTYEVLRNFYEKSVALEKRIEAHAIENNIDFPGYFTSIAFLPMATADELPIHVVKNLGMCVAISAFWILVFSWCPVYAVLYAVMMICNICLVMGTMSLSGWKIGTDETLILSSIVAFSTEMFCHPILAIARDKMRVGTFARLQAAMTTFCVSTLCTFITFIGAGVVMFASVIVFLKEFAAFSLICGFSSLLDGLFVLPILYTLVSCK